MSVRQRSGEMGQDAPLFPDSRARAVLAAGMAKAAAVRTGGPADVEEARLAGQYSRYFRENNRDWHESEAEFRTGVSALDRAARGKLARQARLEKLIRNRDLANADREKRIANAWKRETADDGRVYWWNDETGETTWNEQVPPLSRSGSEVGAKVEPVDYKLFHKIVLQELEAYQGRPGKEEEIMEEIMEEIQETPLLTPEEATSWVAKQGNKVAWGRMLTHLLFGSGIGLPLMIRLYNLATENGGSVDYSGNDSGNYSGNYSGNDSGNYSGGYSGNDSGNYSGGYSGNDSGNYSGGFLPPPWAEPPYLAAAYNGAPGADVDAVVRRKGRDERWSAI